MDIVTVSDETEEVDFEALNVRKFHNTMLDFKVQQSTSKP